MVLWLIALSPVLADGVDVIQFGNGGEDCQGQKCCSAHTDAYYGGDSSSDGGISTQPHGAEKNIQCLGSGLDGDRIEKQPSLVNRVQSLNDRGGANFSPLYQNFQEGDEGGKAAAGLDKGNGEVVIFAGGAFVKNGGFAFKTTRIPLGRLLGEVGGTTSAGEGDVFILHRGGERILIDSKNVNFPLQDGDFVFAFERLGVDK
jgi:hypothetical protein